MVAAREVPCKRAKSVSDIAAVILGIMKGGKGMEVVWFREEGCCDGIPGIF